jgi:sugar phosphate isomerase/epimerase
MTGQHRKRVIIFDIDGTLANVDHRVHHLRGDDKDWGAFFAAADADRPHDEIAYLNRMLAADPHNVVLIVTGRPERQRAATLDWLERHQLDRTALLMDVGHCLISEEDPAQAAVLAGRRLGYVHFDDNDSVGDLHWPLLTGRLTLDMVDALIAILKLSNYQGGLALELNARNADPVKALADGKAILEKALC